MMAMLMLMMCGMAMCCCFMLAAAIIVAKMGKKGSGSGGSSATTPTTTTTTTTNASSSGNQPDATTLASDSMKWGGTKPAAGTKLGNVVVTYYSFQSNTPACTNTSASGKLLEAYVSIALPFSYLTDRQGGPYQYGDWFELESLKGKRLPNGKIHTGLVRLDTTCGDLGNYSYCLHQQGSGKYSGVDLYLGDFRTSGMVCDGKGTATGPAGNGLTFTGIKYVGPNPKGAVTSYGLPSRATDCLCNDAVTACMQQTKLSRQICAADVAKGQVRRPDKVVTDRCFAWMPQYDDTAHGWCFSAQGATKKAKKNGGL